MEKAIEVRAGSSILSVIKDGGLDLRNVKVISGAAGGPKWLILYHMDRFVASHLEHRKIGRDRIFFVGSSIGSWRLTALSWKHPLEGIDAFFRAYMDQRYSLKPTMEEISQEASRIFDKFMGGQKSKEVFENPRCSLNIITVRSDLLTGSDRKIPSLLGITVTSMLNLFHRKNLRWLFTRCLFTDTNDGLPLDFAMDYFPTEVLPLGSFNLKEVLMASGSIPLVMKAVRNIPHAPKGTYRDGGLIDYHLDLPYKLGSNEDFVFFPHYSRRIVPGWFDKNLGRRPLSDHMKQVLMVAPSDDFVKRLPYGKIADRDDFYRFKGDDKERLLYWHKVVEAGKILVEEFVNALESGKIRELAKPFE